jgi:hypothetical protein
MLPARQRTDYHRSTTAGRESINTSATRAAAAHLGDTMQLSTIALAALAALTSSLAFTPAPGQKRGAAYTKDLQAFFKDVDKNYPFFKAKGIVKDWQTRKQRLLKAVRKCKDDASFIAIASEALIGLRDGHAGFIRIRPKLPPTDPEYYPGVVFLPGSQERVIVAAVTKGLELKLPVGSVVDKIDGKPARGHLDGLGAKAWDKGGHFSSLQRATFFEYRLPLRGARGAKSVVEATAPDGKKRKVTLRAEYPVKGWMHLYNPPADLKQAAESVYHARLCATGKDAGPATGYIWLRRMDASAEQGVGKAIEAHGEARRWIVDLRGNTGGGYDRSFKTLIARLGNRVAVIIDAGAISAAETFTRDLVNICKARVFGATSAGSSSSKTEFTFPSGIATIRYSVRSRSGVGGKAIEFLGITPDVQLEADPTDVAEGRNTEILAALEWLKQQH